MRHIPSTLALALMLSLAAGSNQAEDSGILDGMKEKAEPLLYAIGLLGSPYKFGGNDPKTGVDCSGFVRHVYKKSGDVELPRSAGDMSKQGETVAKEALQPGDLVFFNTRRKPYSHVGIYAGNGQFVHAASSKSKQVMVSNMGDGYWSKRFDGARRLLGMQPKPDSALPGQ